MSLLMSTLRQASLLNHVAVNLDANDEYPKAPLGVDIPVNSALGMMWLRYIKNNSASALTWGNIAVLDADVTVTAGALVTATRVTTTGLTANAHVGKLLIVDGNDTSAGAAPEGEVGVVVANSATAIDIDPAYPFSVASVADVDVRLRSPGWHGTLGGANALARNVLGAVAGVEGISAGQYGWVIREGLCTHVDVTAAGVTAGNNVITAASGHVLEQPTAANANLIIGYAPGTIESTHPGNMPIYMTLLSSVLNDAV